MVLISGGYDAFRFDVTDALEAGKNELVVSVWNPLKADVPDAQVLGKQRQRPGGIMYTSATGIWQTVWLEPVPSLYIARMKITPDVDASSFEVVVSCPNPVVDTGDDKVRITVSDRGKVVAETTSVPGSEAVLAISKPHLWSPEDPHLYQMRVTLSQDGKTSDTVESYAALRKIGLGKDERGRTRILLNNKPYLQIGALDQGYWPDGIYTAPTDDALRYDIEAAKKLGFNLLRKHAKVEPDRWYYWTDKLGMLVWQDMPQMFGRDAGPGKDHELTDAAKTRFATEWGRIITQHYNSPSIVVWTTFNEGWGQHNTPAVVARTRKLDRTRLVNNASGWTDRKVGDIHDAHSYPGPGALDPEPVRAAVCGEFGGVTLDAGHRFNANPVMGYGSTLKSGWRATRNFQNLMKKAYEMTYAHGTSAFVYTQLTDVEQEINGLLTYDRALAKLDEKIVTAANKGEFLAIPPNPNPELVPTADDAPVEWKYTFDKPAGDWLVAGYSDREWKTGLAPFGGDDFGNVRTRWKTSDIWIRRQFTLAGEIPAKLHLLVKHDEDAEIYLNGVLAATVSGYNGDYDAVAVSAAARATLKPGENTFAVHVHQTVGGQGIDVGIAVGP